MTRDNTSSLQSDNVEGIGKINHSQMIEAGVKQNKKLDNWKMILCIYWMTQNIYFQDKPQENVIDDDKNMDENV